MVTHPPTQPLHERMRGGGGGSPSPSATCPFCCVPAPATAANGLPCRTRPEGAVHPLLHHPAPCTPSTRHPVVWCPQALPPFALSAARSLHPICRTEPCNCRSCCCWHLQLLVVSCMQRAGTHLKGPPPLHNTPMVGGCVSVCNIVHYARVGRDFVPHSLLLLGVGGGRGRSPCATLLCCVFDNASYLLHDLLKQACVGQGRCCQQA